MSSGNREIRTPVKRVRADRLVLLSLVSFALSVIVTRLFLHLTGYPMIANDTLHIAHVLWGGLLLFIASLLPLILANHWALRTSAILSGVGVGLFIDEVGKFITMNNDYHFQPAAPIIYAFFLLTVFVYLRIKQPPERTPRAEMYRILEDITEVLDQDLDETERKHLERRLISVSNETDEPNLKRLSNALYDYLESKDTFITPRLLTRYQRVIQPVSNTFTKVVTQRRMKIILVLGLGITGVLALIQFAYLLTAIPNPVPVFSTLLAPFVTLGRMRSAQDALWFLIRLVLQAAAGGVLIYAGGLMVIGRERTGIRVATMTLIIWLSVINLLVFYFDQFGATAATLGLFFLLLALTYYRSLYIIKKPTESIDDAVENAITAEDAIVTKNEKRQEDLAPMKEKQG